MADDIIDRLYCCYADPPCEECTFCAARAEIERLRAVVDALVARPFRGTSVERRDRMYGSGWADVHDALDAWQEARRG